MTMETETMHAPDTSPRQASTVHAPGTPSSDLFSPANFFEASPIPTFVINTAHVVTHMNQACATVLGVQAKDVIGTRTLGRIFYGHDRPILADLVVDGATDSALNMLYQGHARPSPQNPEALEAEHFFPHMGAQGRWLYFTASALRDAEGQLVGAIETLLDITDRKRVEHELVRAQEALNAQLALAHDQLVQNEKLASIGQLAAGVAHEINNPIGYIFSNFGTLEKYLADLFEMLTAYESAEGTVADASTRAQLKALRERIELEFLKEDIPSLMRESREGIVRVRKIVQDLKDFSHVDATQEWQFAALVQCIDSTVNVVNNEIKYKADVVREYVDIPDVECHASEINQVIMNLLVNAAQAIGPERGTITIRNGADDKHVWFEIADTGSGIDKASLARIFDPFYTTKPVGKGTGLGLSISYGIVQKHHGQIHVQSEVGKGTRFRVELPIVQPVEADAAAIPSA
jgi:two-component system, NtrC family, sensor kinase